MINSELSDLEEFRYKSASKTALLVFGYNRPENLDRLLSSLVDQRAREPDDIDLVIFLDGPRSAKEAT